MPLSPRWKAVCLFLLLASPLSASQPGVFNVADYPSPADAFAAAATAGGGTVYFSNSVTLSSTQAIGDNIAISCADTGVVINTNSPTADLFLVTGTLFSAERCQFGYNGPGIKTAGALVHLTGSQATLHDVVFSGRCFYCIQASGAGVNITDAIFWSNNSTAPAAGSAALVLEGIVAHLSGITVFPSAPNAEYTYGIKIPNNVALDATNLGIMTTTYGMALLPGSGTSVFVKVSNSYFDNCEYCLAIQPNGGTVGYAEFSSIEFGPTAATGVPVIIDQASHGGNIGKISIANSSIYAYTAGTANCVVLNGSLNSVTLANNDIGSNCTTGVAVQPSTTGRLILVNNNFSAGSYAYFLSSNLGMPIIQGNYLGGGQGVIGANSAALIVNNGN